MLEFVHVSGSSGGKDLQTRRKVRSQAMRDFRRRQREEREAGKPGSKSHSKRLSVPGSRSVSPAWTGRERATSTGSESTEASSRRQSARSVPSPRPIPIMSQKDGESTFQTMHVTQPSSLSSYDMTALNEMEDWQLESTSTSSNFLSSNWQTSVARDPSPSAMPQDQLSWGSETDDFFDSTAQVGQMLGFCRSYLHWLRPGVETETAGNALGQAWDQSKSPMLLAACCLASVGHLDAVQPDRPPGNYEVYKASVLRHISKRMQSPDTATSDETVGALACLLSFEMSKGSGEALTHLQGLKSIVNLKGGMDRLQINGISIMIETLDLLHAVLFDGQPVLSESPRCKSATPATFESLSDAEAFGRLPPILIAEQEDFRQSEHVQHAEQLEGLCNFLRNATTCLDVESDKTATLASIQEAIYNFRTSLVDFGRQSCRDDPLTPDAIHLGRSCYFTASTLFNLIVNKIPHRHERNRAFVEQVFDAVRRVKHSTWQPIPYLRLFILLSAAVTTNKQTMKSFFKAELVRTIYQLGADEWRRVETFILRFLEMKRILERTERRLSTPLEMDSSRLLKAVSAQSWQVGSGTHTTLAPSMVVSSMDYGLSRTPSPMSFATAPASQHATPYEENIDPFLRFGTIEEEEY